MTVDPSVLLALDLGTATAAGAVIGRVGDRRRLLGSVALPAGVPEDALADHLVRRVIASDPEVAERLDLQPRA